MSKKILVVEDDEAIYKLLKRQLEASGYVALVASDGDTGLELARKEKPSLIILDVGLPVINGTQLCELIKLDSATKNAKVIMLTGGRLMGAMEDSFSAGADVYMNKPYQLTTLLGHIKDLIG